MGTRSPYASLPAVDAHRVAKLAPYAPRPFSLPARRRKTVRHA
jgi:hypothetical protein